MQASLQNSGEFTCSDQPLWRKLLICFALLAFTLQTYAGLTHFHDHPLSAQAHVSLPSGHAPGHDAADCPICTHIQLAGHFLLPADVAAAAPSLAVQIIAVALAPAIFPAAVSHIWRGRGPPRI